MLSTELKALLPPRAHSNQGKQWIPPLDPLPLLCPETKCSGHLHPPVARMGLQTTGFERKVWVDAFDWLYLTWP